MTRYRARSAFPARENRRQQLRPPPDIPLPSGGVTAGDTDVSAGGPALTSAVILVQSPNQQRFGVTITRDSTHVTMWLRGDLDLAGRERLVSAARAQLIVHRPSAITIDLGGLEFLAASGISALLGIKRLAERRGIPFALARVPAQVHRLFRMCGIADLYSTAGRLRGGAAKR